jgi:predicted amidohydrolase YtcJ
MTARRTYLQNPKSLAGVGGSNLQEKLGNPSSRARIDEAAGGRPVLLVDDWHHSKLANSEALSLSGISVNKQDPDSGTITRRADCREPTGVLFEAAGLIVERAMNEINPMTPILWADTSEQGIKILRSYGVAAFQDAGASLELLGALKKLDDEGRLKAWVVSCLMANNMIFDAEPIVEALISQGDFVRTTHHRSDFIKTL